MVYVFLNIKNYLNFLPASFSYFLLLLPAKCLLWASSRAWLVPEMQSRTCSPTLGRFWLPMTEKATQIGVTCVGLYHLRQQGRVGSGLWVQPLPLALLWLSWLLLSDLKKGVASQVFVICSQGDTLLGLVCVCAPHPPTHRMHMHISPEALSMLDFKSLWLESWLFAMTNHPITCRGNGVTVIGLDRWRFPRACSIQPGMDGVISESFPLLYYMRLIIRGVFCRIPCSQPPSSLHSVGTASLELVGTMRVYLTAWAVVSLLPHDAAGVCVLLHDCFTLLISSLSFYYSLDANRPALQFGSRHLATAHLMVLLQE